MRGSCDMSGGIQTAVHAYPETQLKAGLQHGQQHPARHSMPHAINLDKGARYLLLKEVPDT